jgi:hypothetical protein
MLDPLFSCAEEFQPSFLSLSFYSPSFRLIAQRDGLFKILDSFNSMKRVLSG